MIGAVSNSIPYTFDYGGYAASLRDSRTQRAQQPQQPQHTLVNAAQKTANPEAPVQPVKSTPKVASDAPSRVQLGPELRQGADPAEMAVRMRIQDGQNPAEEMTGADVLAKLLGKGKQDAGTASDVLSKLQGKDQQDGPKTENNLGAESVQEAAKEGECQTCKERKYQDGSDDAGVSFKTPTHIDPDMAPSMVRGHEMEHVTREQAKAGREDRKVVSQSVSYHTAICPECGRSYVSGGTTRTTTAAVEPTEQTQAQQTQKDNQTRVPFSAVA